MARNKDYIPTTAESLAESEAIMDYIKSTPDPRHSYSATYTLFGKTFTETVMAFNAAEAEKHVKQQCSLVGCYPIDIEIEEITN